MDSNLSCSSSSALEMRAFHCFLRDIPAIDRTHRRWKRTIFASSAFPIARHSVPWSNTDRTSPTYTFLFTPADMSRVPKIVPLSAPKTAAAFPILASTSGVELPWCWVGWTPGYTPHGLRF